MPGGETKVSRRLERIVVEVGVWWMRPMPSLLAEPSQPRAIQEVLGDMVAICVMEVEVGLMVRGESEDGGGVEQAPGPREEPLSVNILALSYVL